MDNKVKKCSGCAFADFRYNDAPSGSGCSTFLCTRHNKVELQRKRWDGFYPLPKSYIIE